MFAVKSVLAASVILGTLGLAGCQTTEESTYYSSGVSYRPRTVYYDETPRWRPAPPPRVIVAPPPPVYYGDYRPRPPRVYDGWNRGVNPPPRYERGYRYHSPAASNPMRPTSGNEPGYDTH